MNDNVNHPSHYTQHKYECIQFIENMTDTLIANAFKYVWRCDDKGKREEDLSKALFYMNQYRKHPREMRPRLDSGIGSRLVNMLDGLEITNPKKRILRLFIVLNCSHFTFHSYEIIKEIETLKGIK